MYENKLHKIKKNNTDVNPFFLILNTKTAQLFKLSSFLKIKSFNDINLLSF